MICPEDGDIKAHLNAMIKIRDELEGIGASVMDDDFATMILTSLLPSYRSLLHSIMHAASLSSTEISPNDLMRIVLEEARQREIADLASKSGDAALHVKKTRGRKGKSEDSGTKTPCTNCKCTNHKTENCYADGRAKQGQAPWQKKKEKANTAAVSTKRQEHDEEYLAFTCLGNQHEAATAAHSTPKAHDIILDSGATAHFCPDRSMFVCYSATSPTAITAADGRELKAVGHSNIIL